MPRLEIPYSSAQNPTSHTSVTSPAPGKATSRAPNTIVKIPPRIIQNSPSISRRNSIAATIWSVPIAIAQNATRYRSVRAVMPGHTSVAIDTPMPSAPMNPVTHLWRRARTSPRARATSSATPSTNA